jgi:competence protein ComEC
MPNLTFEFLDVGQGDGTLIRFPNGEVMLIDLGSLKNRKITLKDINKYVYDYFPRLHLLEHLEYLIITHGDADHYNLIESLLKYNKVTSIGKLIYSGTTRDYKSFGKTYLNKLIKMAETVVTPPSAYHSDPDEPELEIGGVKIWFLSANYPERSGGDTNPKSIVTRFEYGNVVVILCGDATKNTEEGILNYYSTDFLRCDLLKIPHHGSMTSSSTEWIAATLGPTGNKRNVAVAVSSDMRDGFGLPRCPVLQRYIDFGTLWVFPANIGWVCWKTDSNYWDDNVGKTAILGSLITANQGIQWEYETDGTNINVRST